MNMGVVEGHSHVELDITINLKSVPRRKFCARIISGKLRICKMFVKYFGLADNEVHCKISKGYRTVGFCK